MGDTLSGRTPEPLDRPGEADAVRLAQHFASIPLASILSSPQRRTQQTAAAIAAAHSLPVQTVPALDEIDFGPWTGQPFAALAGRPDWTAWNTSRSLAPAPDTETMLQVQARAAALLPRLHAAAPGRIFVLVTHADVLKSLLAHALAIPIDLMQRLEVSPASHSLLSWHDGWVVVDYINRPA